MYSELLGCSERSDPWREVTSDGEVKEEVCGDACLILRLVSLPWNVSLIYALREEEHTPVEIRCLDITKAFGLTRADNQHVRWDKVVTL